MRSIMLMCATAASSLLLLACGTSSSDTDAGQVSAGESQLLGTWGTPDQESQAPSYTFERGGEVHRIRWLQLRRRSVVSQRVR